MSVVTPPSTEQQGFIRNIASSFSNTNEGIETGDIVQELYVQWYERWPAIQVYVEHDDPDQGQALLLRTLQNWALAYCKKEMAARTGMRPDDLYYYSRRQIQKMLPLVESPEAWSSLSVVGEKQVGKSPKLANEGNDMLAHFADLTYAWDRLTDSQRRLLRDRFAGSETPYAELADELGLSESNIRKQVERAITTLQKYMGGAKRAEPKRRAMSNATAQVMTREAWNGD